MSPCATIRVAARTIVKITFDGFIVTIRSIFRVVSKCLRLTVTEGCERSKTPMLEC